VTPACTACGSDRLQASVRQWFMGWIGWRRYDCLTCRRTILLRRVSRPVADDPPEEVDPPAPKPVQPAELQALDLHVERALEELTPTPPPAGSLEDVDAILQVTRKRKR
jgi:hypothetical protein